MEKFFKFIESKFMEPMTKLANQKHIKAIRDGMVSTIPLTIVGSFFLIIAFPPVPQAWKETVPMFIWIQAHIGDILLPFRLTMGMVAVYAVYNIGHSLAKSYNLDGVSGGTLSLVGFMLSIIPQMAQTTGENPTGLGWVLPMGNLGGAGLFAGMLVAIYSVEVLRFFKQKGFVIKMPDGVPESVTRSFEALFPTVAVVLSISLLTIFLKFDLHKFFYGVFNPLKDIVNSPFGTVALVLGITMLWSCGIHGVSVIGAVARPIWLELLNQNADALATGAKVLPNIAPEPFYQWFVWIGGSGGTLGLVLLFMTSKSQHLKNLGRASIVPGLFNINEPIIFGAPVMLNPFLVIPFILGPVVTTIISYTAMSMNIVGRPVILAPWTFPAPIGAFLSTNGSLGAVVLCLANIVIATLIYFPFFKAYEKKLLNEEGGLEAEAINP